MSSHQSPTPAGAYRHQDWQVVFSPRRGVDPHPERRLSERVHGEYSKEDVRVLWREAEPVDYEAAYGNAYARYHQQTDLLLIARFGCLSTLLELEKESERVQEHVRRQVES